MGGRMRARRPDRLLPYQIKQRHIGSDNLSSRKRQNVRKQRRMLVYLAAVVLIALAWVYLTSKETLILHSQRFTTTYDTQSFLVKDEQVLHFDRQPAPQVSEGVRVSMQTVLFENSGSIGGYYLEQRSLLASYETIPTKEALLREIVSEKNHYQELSSDQDEGPTVENISRLSALLQYADLDEESLEDVKEDVGKLAADPYEGFTLLKLGGKFPGYLFYSLDGYESLLTPENMEALAILDMQDLSDTAAILKGAQEGMKVVNDDTAYIMLTVPENLLPNSEELLEKKKTSISENLRDGEEYLEYLNRRIDILRSMPSIGFILNDEEYTAKLVDIIPAVSEENNVWILQLKDYLTGDFLAQRQFDIQVLTYENRGYIVPESSLLTKDGKTYIVVLSKGYLRKNLEVNVTKTQGDQVFLSLKDNEAITEGMQLLINP